MLTCKGMRKEGAGRPKKRVVLVDVGTGKELSFTDAAELRQWLYQGQNYSDQTVSRNCRLELESGGYRWKYL